MFMDDFNSTSLGMEYTLSSSDPERYSLTERPGFLRLKHGADTFLVLLDTPDTDFVFEISNSYLPVLESDFSGIVAWKSMDDYVELLEWYDTSQDTAMTYPYMRLEKVGLSYTGYGSQDGETWTLIGTIKMVGAGKIGLVINGPLEDESVPFDVDYVKIFRNKYLQVTNLNTGYVVQLFSSTAELLEEVTVGAENGAKLDLTNYLGPFDANLRIVNALGEELLYTAIQVQQGDIYYYGDVLDVYRITDEGEEFLLPTQDISLGTMSNGNILQKFRIHNSTPNTFHNISVGAVQYDANFGYQWVTLAEDVAGVAGTFASPVELGDLPNGESKYFWVKVTRDTNHLTASVDPYRFALIVMND
jgi:hypothetical protein